MNDRIQYLFERYLRVPNTYHWTLSYLLVNTNLELLLDELDVFDPWFLTTIADVLLGQCLIGPIIEKDVN